MKIGPWHHAVDPRLIRCQVVIAELGIHLAKWMRDIAPGQGEHQRISTLIDMALRLEDLRNAERSLFLPN